MKLVDLKLLIARIEECDKTFGILEANQYNFSPSMLSALQGAVIERKVSMLAQLARIGVEI